jgi:IclR family acetate operon transcriptional repressor
MGLLERLAEAERGMSLTDLSMQFGLPAATTHRLLNTFEQLGYVQQDEELGRWFIGVKAFTVGSAFLNRRDFVATARPFMHTLMEESGETVNLAVLDDGEVVIVGQVESREMMRMIVQLGSHAPVHASGMGKALFARLPDYEVTKILHKRGLTRFTDSTIDTPAALREEIRTIQRQGYAVDDEEHAVGLRCVAATIHDEFGGPLAAISLSGPKARITDNRVPELGVMVARAAAEITKALGGRMPTRDTKKSA